MSHLPSRARSPSSFVRSCGRQQLTCQLVPTLQSCRVVRRGAPEVQSTRNSLYTVLRCWFAGSQGTTSFGTGPRHTREPVRQLCFNTYELRKLSTLQWRGLLQTLGSERCNEVAGASTGVKARVRGDACPVQGLRRSTCITLLRFGVIEEDVWCVCFLRFT